MAHPDISAGEIPGYVVSKKVRNMAGYNRKGGRVGALALFSIVALTACNGPNQEAGREQDKASATARGEPYSGSGPNERIGEVRDRAAAAEQNVRDAAADALKAQGRNLERQADINATRLDEQARSIRDAADKRADALDAQSRSIRDAADKQADALYEQARAAQNNR
jgi:hypothetical protein